MTRTGKIARLPRPLRDELNRRLQDGAPGVDLVAWLNGLPEVQAVLAAAFGGRAINEQNLTEWKQGGFLEWQQHQEALALARELAADAAELKQLTEAPLSDAAAPLLTAKYMGLLQTLNTANPVTDWKRLRQMCNDLVALRQGDHSAERLKLEQQQLGIAERTLQLKQQMLLDVALHAFFDEVKDNPEALAAFDEFRAKVTPLIKHP